MQLIEFISLIATFAGLFFWSRTESRADSRRIEDMVLSIHREILAEMKDFHGRLCALEEKKKGK